MFDLMPFASLPKEQLMRRTQMRALVAKEHNETDVWMQLSVKDRVVASSSSSSSSAGASATVVIGIDDDGDDHISQAELKAFLIKHSR